MGGGGAVFKRELRGELRMAVAGVEEFVALLERSGLLSADRMRRVREFAETESKPRGLAQIIVKQGWLTRWQAQQLLAGRHRLFLGKYKLLMTAVR